MNVLAGVDDIPWATLDHCYGTSDDIPPLLRETAEGSAEALEKLCEYMLHQGTLYEVTPHLVRFLGRIAAAGIHTSDILMMLGIVAKSADNQDAAIHRQTRAAFALELGALIPLLADTADDIRDSAAWALPQSLAAERLIPALRERWDRETVPSIAASVLRGLSFLDPGGTVPLAAAALDNEDATITLNAAVACAAGGMSWSDDLSEAALAWVSDDVIMKDFRWSFRSGHPFSDLLDMLAAHGEPAVAAELASAALTIPATGDVRKMAVLAAGSLAEISRSATPVLVTPLISVLRGDDVEAGISAIMNLLEIGGLKQAANELAVLADVEGPGRRADLALSCLVQLGDPRFVPLLVRDRRHRPRARESVRGTDLIITIGGRPPFSAALLEEIRSCLRAGLLGEKATPDLVRMIGSWGPDAAAAIPDLLSVLPRHEDPVAYALADIAGAIPEAVSPLRQMAASGTSLAARARLRAASRLHALTGDQGPLLAAVTSGLALSGYDLSDAVKAACDLTPTPELIPVLNAARQELARTDCRYMPDSATRLTITLALWQHSADPEPALGIITEKLGEDHAPYYPYSANAVRAAAVLGPAAAPLIPAILPLLDSHLASTAAVRALLRIDPDDRGGVPFGRLAECLMLPLDRTLFSRQIAAVEMLGEIGLSRLPDHVVARLRELASQDRRIIHGGALQGQIRDDDRLRRAIRALLSG